MMRPLLRKLTVLLLAFLCISGLPYALAENAVSKEADIVLTGDIMCLAGQLSAAKKGSGWNFDYAFESIRPMLFQADAAIGNLETPVAGKEQGVTQFNQEGNPIINAPVDFLDSVKKVGFDCLVTANNHAFDKGDLGISETIKNLDRYGFYHCGTNLSDYMQDEVVIMDVNGIKVAVLSYTQFVNTGTAAYKKSGKMFKLNLIDDYDSFTKIRHDIETAKARNADYIIVYTHWGVENVNTSNEYQRTTARAIADLGADLIIGSHSHTVQPDEYIETSDGRKVFVIYSMGNLISSMPRDINHDTLMIDLHLTKSGGTVLEELSYMCLTAGNRQGKQFAVLPSRLASSHNVQKNSMEASIKRTTAILDDIQEVDCFSYVDYDYKF
ncbi:MAG: CapA family protein [Clostridia bacterium]|nr:CapA family protein [Clostridia bacterium]